MSFISYKLIRKFFYFLGFFLLYTSSTHGKASDNPSLSDTINFLSNNIDGADVISCEEIVIDHGPAIARRYKKSSRQEPIPNSTWQHFNIRDVEFGNYNAVLSFQCIDGECAKYTQDEDEAGRFSSLELKATKGIIITRIDRERVRAALLHLQRLCGGAKKPIF